MDSPRKLISLPSCPLSQPFVRQLDLVPPGERLPTFFWLLRCLPTSYLLTSRLEKELFFRGQGMWVTWKWGR